MNPNVTYEPGAAITDGIPLCVPEFRGNEWQYVQECLDTGWVSSVGAYVERFERACCDVSGAKHAVAMVNGTAALHIALLCAGVEADDEVLTSALTFIAPANAIRYANAAPVFIDSEPSYWQIDPAIVEAFLRDRCERRGDALFNRASGRRVRALLPVDVLGTPADMQPLRELATRYGLALIEDATESLGARYHDGAVGAFSDAFCYSFNGNKLITTGGGGMLLTNNAEFARRARYLSTQAKTDPVEYVHGDVGYNYRLTNVQAAIGVAQLERLDEYVAIKRRNAERYRAGLDAVAGITCMQEPAYGRSAFWLFTILVDPAAFGRDSRALLRALAERNIQARPLWQPMHRSPAHAGAEFAGSGVADDLCARALSLPSSVGLTESQLDTVVGAIREACG